MIYFNFPFDKELGESIPIILANKMYNKIRKEGKSSNRRISYSK